MALHDGLNPRCSPVASHAVRLRREDAPAPGFRNREAVVGATGAAPAHWLDRMLGAGSGRAIQSLARPGRPAERGPKAGTAPPRIAARTARLSVVGGGEPARPKGLPGLGRALLVLMAVAGSAAALRPWQREGRLKADWSTWIRASDPAGPSRPVPAPAADARQLAALPLRPAQGRWVGLWKAPNGAVWAVDADGALAPCPDPSADPYLGLPRIVGPAGRAEAYRGGRRLRLDLPTGRLGELLPLRPEVASEIDAMDLRSPDHPVLVTFSGVRCLMNGADWDRGQRRLALVLADLAARRKPAGSIDLRFEDAVVVRPPGR